MKFKIEREIELRALNDLFRFSDTIKKKSPSPEEASDILERLKQRLDELDIP